MSDTPETDEIMRRHDECHVKLATPANRHAVRSRVERLERERDAAREALLELVRLKDLHDRIESYGNPVFAGLGAMVDEYKRCKPLAWDRARAILEAKP